MFIVYKGTEKERIKCCLISRRLPKKDFNRKWDFSLENSMTVFCSSSSFGDHFPEGILHMEPPGQLFYSLPATPRNFNSCQMSGRI